MSPHRVSSTEEEGGHAIIQREAEDGKGEGTNSGN